ncbi:putative quinol monooxygenase [Chromobacterium aquaticum]|uniref:Quinol monooxygenase n=1 Tax=Chromobacterium aquaticum TaxID=467180 RepID=A0ABV9A1S0_9NEIS|nr:putative quinol monooxygenase [Chromobacterium aquaticum]MCD5362402.1 antibiotic biosynthesis monooxygenase [Chromobacterium aquaticum]
MLHVVAVITAQPGQRAAVLRELNAIVPEVRLEEGCIEYGPALDHEDSPRPFGADSLVVLEKWESKAALDQHLAAPPLRAFIAATEGMVASLAVHVLNPA